MEQEEYLKLFDLEDRLWWFLGMRCVSKALLDRYVPTTGSPPRILDAGCGTGGMVEMLRLYGPTFGLDASWQALHFANKRVPLTLSQGDVCKLPYASESFDLVTSFDVIYHSGVSTDEIALLEIARVLRPCGLVLLRVPAFNLLRGRHDAAVHTRRRYSKRELEQKLMQAGFVHEFISYSYCILFPVALLRRGTERLLRPAHQGSEVESVPSWLNQALYWILRMESRWLRTRTFPFGLSLVAVARKKAV